MGGGGGDDDDDVPGSERRVLQCEGVPQDKYGDGENLVEVRRIWGRPLGCRPACGAGATGEAWGV